MADRLHTYVSITKNDWATAILGVDEVCRRAASAAFDASADPSMMDVEVSILLSDDEKLKALNRKYRNTDKATNVLSFSSLINSKAFSFVQKPLLLGDIVVAYEATHDEAKMENKKLEDHLSHLVIHGMLHLLGHDHESKEQAELMESIEIQTLKSLGVSDPYNTSEPMDLG